jgi:hypothetical protein
MALHFLRRRRSGGRCLGSFRRASFCIQIRVGVGRYGSRLPGRRRGRRCGRGSAPRRHRDIRVQISTRMGRSMADRFLRGRRRGCRRGNSMTLRRHGDVRIQVSTRVGRGGTCRFLRGRGCVRGRVGPSARHGHVRIEIGVGRSCGLSFGFGWRSRRGPVPGHGGVQVQILVRRISGTFRLFWCITAHFINANLPNQKTPGDNAGSLNSMPSLPFVAQSMRNHKSILTAVDK